MIRLRVHITAPRAVADSAGEDSMDRARPIFIIVLGILFALTGPSALAPAEGVLPALPEQAASVITETISANAWYDTWKTNRWHAGLLGSESVWARRASWRHSPRSTWVRKAGCSRTHRRHGKASALGTTIFRPASISHRRSCGRSDGVRHQTDDSLSTAGELTTVSVSPTGQAEPSDRSAPRDSCAIRPMAHWLAGEQAPRIHPMTRRPAFRMGREPPRAARSPRSAQAGSVAAVDTHRRHGRWGLDTTARPHPSRGLYSGVRHVHPGQRGRLLACGIDRRNAGLLGKQQFSGHASGRHVHASRERRLPHLRPDNRRRAICWGASDYGQSIPAGVSFGRSHLTTGFGYSCWLV